MTSCPTGWIIIKKNKCSYGADAADAGTWKSKNGCKISDFTDRIRARNTLTSKVLVAVLCNVFPTFICRLSFWSTALAVIILWKAASGLYKWGEHHHSRGGSVFMRIFERGCSEQGHLEFCHGVETDFTKACCRFQTWLWQPGNKLRLWVPISILRELRFPCYIRISMV